MKYYRKHVLRDSKDRFVSIGFEIVPNRYMVCPRIDEPIYDENSKIWDVIEKKSIRHDYCILSSSNNNKKNGTSFSSSSPTEEEEEEEEEGGSLDGKIQTIKADKQKCVIDHPNRPDKDPRIKCWIWRDDGTYKLQLTCLGDPRLNGSPVYERDTRKCLGMYDSSSFTKNAEITPFDLFYVTPTLNRLIGATPLIWYTDDTSLDLISSKLIKCNFREYDFRAEKGLESTFETKDDDSYVIKTSQQKIDDDEKSRRRPRNPPIFALPDGSIFVERSCDGKAERIKSGRYGKNFVRRDVVCSSILHKINDEPCTFADLVFDEAPIEKMEWMDGKKEWSFQFDREEEKETSNGVRTARGWIWFWYDEIPCKKNRRNKNENKDCNGETNLNGNLDENNDDDARSLVDDCDAIYF